MCMKLFSKFTRRIINIFFLLKYRFWVSNSKSDETFNINSPNTYSDISLEWVLPSLTGETPIFGLKLELNQKSNSVSENSDPKIPNFDISFDFSSLARFVNLWYGISGPALKMNRTCDKILELSR